MRRLELDYCRFVACLMIITLHIAGSGWHIAVDSFEWSVYNFYDMIVRGAVPVFFMISGALFLERETLDTGRLLRKNVPHLLLVYFSWSLLYAVEEQLSDAGAFSVHQFILKIISGHFHMWFLVSMITVYLFLPVVHSAIHGNKINVIYILGLFGLFSVLKSNLLLISEKSDILSALCGKINISNVQYLGYMVLGYYLAERRWDKKWRVLCPILFLLGGFVFSLANQWYSIRAGEPKPWLYGHFTVASLFFAVCIFIFFQSFRGERFRGEKWISALSADTLGVYMMHPLLIELFRNNGISVSRWPAVVSVPIAVACVAVVCFTVTGVCRKIPGIQRCVE